MSEYTDNLIAEAAGDYALNKGPHYTPLPIVRAIFADGYRAALGAVQPVTPDRDSEEADAEHEAVSRYRFDHYGEMSYEDFQIPAFVAGAVWRAERLASGVLGQPQPEALPEREATPDEAFELGRIRGYDEAMREVGQPQPQPDRATLIRTMNAAQHEADRILSLEDLADALLPLLGQPRTDAPLDRKTLIGQVERALDDKYHEQLCSCGAWPESCVTYGDRVPWSYGHEDVIDALISMLTGGAE